MALGDKAQEVTILNLKKDEDYDDAPDEFIGKDPEEPYSQINLQKFLDFYVTFKTFMKWLVSDSNWGAGQWKHLT